MFLCINVSEQKKVQYVFFIKITNFPPIMSLQKCPSNYSHKEIESNFFIAQGLTFLFYLTGVEQSALKMPKHPLPQKKKLFRQWRISKWGEVSCQKVIF